MINNNEAYFLGLMYAKGDILTDENDKNSAVSLGKEFTIYGYSNTVAKTYADKNGLRFVPLDSGILIGDVDLNGVVNVFDATLVQKFSSSLVTLTNEQLANADANDDGTVNVFDATHIQRMIAGLV